MSAFKSTSMSRRDYETIAHSFRPTMALLDNTTDDVIELERRVARTAVVVTARHLADELASHDPGFNRDRFLRAAGLSNSDILPDYCVNCQHELSRHVSPFHSHLVRPGEVVQVSCAVLLCECPSYVPGIAS